MGIFFNKSKKEASSVAVSGSTKQLATGTKSKQTEVINPGRRLDFVLIKNRVTEKAVNQQGRNIYTFVVASNATKYDVADAIKKQYNVTPLKVNIVNKAPRKQISATNRRRAVKKAGMKKAYIYLKAGDSLTLV